MTAIPAQISAPVTKVEDVPAYNVRELLAGGRMARIVLDDQVYLLRLTRAEKLILTK